MAYRLRTVEMTATGREIVRDRVLPGPTLTIGRAAENDIHLPDLAVEPQHATITERDSDRIAIESVGSLGFTVDRVDHQSASVDTRAGAELGFGTYRIMVGREGEDILLTVRQADAAATRSGDLEEKLGFSLAGVLPGKRGVSWALGIVILLAFLAVPVISHMTRNVAAKQSVIGDQSWNPGGLSLAHHGLTDKCEACHVKPFESVRDETCVSCHKDVHDHADPQRLAAARGNQPLGTRLLWSVAHTFGKEGPGACQDCHVEHQGTKTELAATSQQFCADCHGELKTNLTDTKLGNAGDFGTLHPQFNPAIVVDPAARKIQTVSLDKHPREDNGLSFPHKLHLDPLGGASRMAATIGAERGYGSKGMQCQDCHHKTEDGVRFKPINMERDCEGCHSLAYDKVGGTFRQLNHGNVDQVIADLTAADITRPLPNPRRRPGEYADNGPYRFNFSQPVWQGLQVRAALSRDGICGECHRPTFTGGKPGVLPVTLQSRYMKHGWFDHAAHKQEPCASCHAAKTSTSATDLLLPGIKACRTCHLGEDAHSAKVPSSCAMCHGYHATAQGAREERRRSSS